MNTIINITNKRLVSILMPGATTYTYGNSQISNN